MNRSEKISIDQIKKIIPINIDVTNFAAEIKITSDVDNVFSMAVINQNDLEDIVDIPYKHITKNVLFNVRNENNILNPYVLVLKTDTPQDVVVSINLQELPMKQQQEVKTTLERLDDSPWYKDWRYWVVIFVILIIFSWFYWRNRNKAEPVIVLSTKKPLSVQPDIY